MYVKRRESGTCIWGEEKLKERQAGEGVREGERKETKEREGEEGSEPRREREGKVNYTSYMYCTRYRY